MRKALYQRPKACAQLVLEGLHQPFGQVVAVPLHQVIGLDGVALFEPVLFLIGQAAQQKVARAMEPQNGQAALFGAGTRRGHVVKQQLFAQHVVNRLGQRGALAGAKAPVVAEKPRDHGVGGVFKGEGEPDEFGTGIDKYFGVHAPIVPPTPRSARAPTLQGSQGSATGLHPQRVLRRHHAQSCAAGVDNLQGLQSLTLRFSYRPPLPP